MSWAKAWDTLRFRKGLLIVAFFSPVPLALFVALPLMSLTDAGWPVFLALFGWFGFIGVASVLLMIFPCPRCGKPFCVGWYQSPFIETCRHCGLKQGTEENDAGHAPRQM